MNTKRKEYDFYPTPTNVIRDLFNNFDLEEYGNKILEPGAGNGNFICVLKELYPKKHITAIEIREEEKESLSKLSNEVKIENFLNTSNNQKYNIIIGNPPYSKAIEFIEKAFDLLDDNGILIFLLRTAFLESKSRYEFWQKNPLSRLYTLSKRPSFTGKSTDSSSYSWFMWDKSTNKQEIRVI